MRIVFLIAAMICCHTMAPIPSFGEQSITLLNEIDEKTGHDNHIVLVQLGDDHADIIRCHGTDIAQLLPLIRVLEDANTKAITVRCVALHEFDIDRKGWVIIGICNRVKNTGAGVYVWSSEDVPSSTAKTLGASFKEIRKLRVKLGSRDMLVEAFTPTQVLR